MSNKTAPEQAQEHDKLGDETFMSAGDLRHYMDELAMTKANEAVSAMDRAEKAREELAKTLAAPIELTPQKLEEIARNVIVKLRAAAERGDTEIMVMRFPNLLCTDSGRAINNALENWPDTLTGRPRQAYELWRDKLKPNGYGLKSMIVDWPNGMPGDVGLFLTWSRG